MKVRVLPASVLMSGLAMMVESATNYEPLQRKNRKPSKITIVSAKTSQTTTGHVMHDVSSVVTDGIGG